jgi:signal transduction histidine kinase
VGRPKRSKARASTEYVSLVTHALMTPLAGVVLWCDMLGARSEIPDSVARGITAIDRSARAQVAILDNLVELSLREAATDDLHRSRFDIAVIVGDAVRRAASMATQGEVELRHARPAGPLEIEGDPARVRVALFNVLDNALKASPRGEHVEIGIEASDDEVTITVQDGGAGVAKAELRRLFAWRELAPRRPRDGRRGLGLGLPVARRIAELHGGTIAARNTPPRGLRVTVTLPRAPTRKS